MVDLKLAMDGEIQESTCDCLVGPSKFAHCKHVVIVLLAVIDLSSKKQVISDKTCTQVLQTFHRPKKNFTASPIKANKFIGRRRIYACDEYNENFKNLVPKPF